MDDASNNAGEKLSILSYRLNAGFTYHRKLEWFFNFLDKFSAAIAVIGASSVLASFFTNQNINKYIQFFIVFTSTFSLVFAWSSKSRQHAELAARYSSLERELVFYKEDNGEELLNKVESMLLDIEAIEPPANSALVRVVQDELDFSRGAVGIDLDSLGFLRKLKAYFWISYDSNKKKTIHIDTYLKIITFSCVATTIGFIILVILYAMKK